MVRVSAIYFLNTVPLIRGMLADPPEDFAVASATPAACAEQLRAGTADIGAIPAIEYLRIPDLVVLGDGAIAAHGAVRSILLLSRRPLREVRTIAADTSSRTSVALAQILLSARFGHLPEMIPHPPQPAAMLEACDAALVIGDPALHYAQAPLPGVIAYDLGAEWQALTGLPFVFAFWGARRRVATPELAERFNAWRDAGVAAVEQIVAEEAPARGLPPEVVRAYLTENIHFRLTPKCVAGLLEFFRRAQALGLAPARDLEVVHAGAPIGVAEPGP
jgi:chorismate dehydratase